LEAYQADSNYAKAATTAALATKKYPNRADYWAQRGNMELKGGQVKEAVTSLKRALAIDPKTPGARMLIVNSLVEANEYDSAVVAIHEAVAAGSDPEPLAQVANIMGNRLLKVGQDTSKGKPAQITAFHRIIGYVSYADSISKDRGTKNNSKFFLGVSHFFLAQLTFNDVIAAKSCDGAKQVQDLLIDATSELPVGGASNPDIVKTLMPVATSMAGSADQAVKAFCAPPKKPEEAPAKKKP
jgi:tetratricopeptide (TPR) repeat protein